MMVKKKREGQGVTALAEPVAFEESEPASNLRTYLEEIKTYDGVIGYILRNSTSAAIDLRDPSKIIDYAVLSSLAFDSSAKFSEIFDLGSVKSIKVEGKDIHMLSLQLAENRIGIFMDKTADAERILRKLQSS